MGYVICMSHCIGCKQPFQYNPVLVPSIVLNGVKEPLCRECVVKFNVVRKEHGLELIVPLPFAYDAAEEDEIPW